MASCSVPDKSADPAGALPKQKMEDILVDLHLAGGIISATPAQADSNARRALGYYKPIFAKHGTNETEFKKSLDIYTMHPIALDSVYSKVIERLTERESSLRR